MPGRLGSPKPSAPDAHQIKEAYVTVKGSELYLFGAHISPLLNASTHIHPDPTRTRKLLLHKAEIDKIIGKVQRAGYTLMRWTCTTRTVASNWKSASQGKNSMTSGLQRKRREGKMEAAQAMKKLRAE